MSDKAWELFNKLPKVQYEYDTPTDWGMFHAGFKEGQKHTEQPALEPQEKKLEHHIDTYVKLVEDQQPQTAENFIGKTVTVFDRYLFAVPVRGIIIGIATHRDKAFQVQFFDDNPGGPNVTRHNGKYFMREQCRVDNYPEEQPAPDKIIKLHGQTINVYKIPKDQQPQGYLEYWNKNREWFNLKRITYREGLNIYRGAEAKYAELVEDLQDDLQKMLDWCNAYPIDIFPEPDFKKAAQVLKDNGMTLDSISASAMRHVVDGMREKIEVALEKLEQEKR